MSNNLKLATVVVCWYPDDELLLNIASYSYGTDLLYVWDNTPGGSSLVDSIQDAIILNRGKQNMGLAFAYNRAIELAEQQGATHIMTMDQDSRFVNFTYFRHCLELHPNEMVCPPLNSSSITDDKIVSYAAQSGCVFPLEMIKQVGGFREDFFIGMVDVEMQMKAQEAGFKVIQIGGCSLIHHVGSERWVYLFRHPIAVSDYTPLRYYYDSRNRILMWKEFPYDFNLRQKLKHILGRIKVMVKIWLFEDGKINKTKAIVRGTVNGFLNRLEPFN